MVFSIASPVFLVSNTFVRHALRMRHIPYIIILLTSNLLTHLYTRRTRWLGSFVCEFRSLYCLLLFCNSPHILCKIHSFRSLRCKFFAYIHIHVNHCSSEFMSCTHIQTHTVRCILSYKYVDLCTVYSVYIGLYIHHIGSYFAFSRSGAFEPQRCPCTIKKIRQTKLPNFILHRLKNQKIASN